MNETVSRDSSNGGPSRPERALRFGAFELDPEAGELRKSGVRVKLQAQPLKVLGLLAANSGQVISRRHIQEHVWEPGTHVDFQQGINACIKAVRSALGDRASAPRFVETVPRRGYRFVAPVETIEPAPDAPSSQALVGAVGSRTEASADDRSPVETSVDEPEPIVADAGLGTSSRRAASPWPVRHRRTWTMLAAIGVLALVAFAILQMAATSGREPQAAPVASRHNRLAVLPFESLDAGDAERSYLGDAITAELITQLGRRYRNRLGVIARTSAMRFKDSRLSLADMARELDVEYVLEGTVHHSGDQVRVTVQLVSVTRQTTIWADSYDRALTDLLAVQEEVAETIATALAIELLPRQTTPVASLRTSTDPAAYRAYLQGRYHLNQFQPLSASRAVAPLQRAIDLDPAFAAAHAALAQAHLGHPAPAAQRYRAARDAARSALALDPDNAEAHLALGQVQFYRDWDLEGARRSFDRAIESDPGYAEAHHAAAAYYSVRGKHEQALAAVERARALDPLSASVNSDVGWYSYFAGRFDDAVAHSRATLELEPGYYWARRCIVVSLWQAGDLAGAVEQAAREMRAQDAAAGLLSDLATLPPERALRVYWTWDLQRVQRIAERRPISPTAAAMIHLALDDHEAALAALEAGVKARDGWILPFLRVDPRVAPLRDDPRFRALMREIESPSKDPEQMVGPRSPVMVDGR